jgi:hypothetical protein
MISAHELQLLAGKNVEMVCFARFSVYIHLHGGSLLTVEGRFEHIHDGVGHWATFPITESGLLTIIESVVTSASMDTNGDVILAFSNGDHLCVSKEAGFESYRLNVGNEEFIP